MTKIPKGWPEVNLLEVAPINAKLVDPRRPEFKQMILIAPDHIESGTGRIIGKVSALDQEAISGKFLVKKRSVIYSKIRPYLMKAAIADEDVLCSADMYPLECTKQVTPSFLLNVLLSNRFTDFAVSCSNRTGIPKINREELSVFTLNLPPLQEQSAIATVLSTWDRAIEKAERLIAAKEKAFNARLNFLIFQGKNRDWKELSLGECFDERVEAGRVDLPLLSITREEGVIPRAETNRKDTSNEDKSKYLRICPGDIGYNSMRMWQGVAGLSAIEGIVSPAYTICIPKTKVIEGAFASHLFKHPWVIHQFYRFSQGLTSDTWTLKFHNFAEINLFIPPIGQQREISALLSSFRVEINLLKKQAESYRKQKRGLMQKLLTGRWRVKK